MADKISGIYVQQLLFLPSQHFHPLRRLISQSSATLSAESCCLFLHAVCSSSSSGPDLVLHRLGIWVSWVVLVLVGCEGIHVSATPSSFDDAGDCGRDHILFARTVAKEFTPYAMMTPIPRLSVSILASKCLFPIQTMHSSSFPCISRRLGRTGSVKGPHWPRYYSCQSLVTGGRPGAIDRHTDRRRELLAEESRHVGYVSGWRWREGMVRLSMGSDVLSLTKSTRTELQAGLSASEVGQVSASGI